MSFYDLETAIQLAYERGEFPTLIMSIRYWSKVWKTLDAKTVIFAPSGARCGSHAAPAAVRSTFEAVWL